uniref:Uncharacterized protein n=1 Tax=Avena sativa TaxID=4498 RepID=A0ACD5UL26_AVESA
MCRKGNADGAASPAGATSTATAILVLASLLLVASVIVFLLSPPPPPAAGGKGHPEPVELAIGVAGHEGWLDALRAWAKLTILRLRPLDPRHDLSSPGSMKKAAKQSLEMGKEAVEHTAESAARAAEETIGRTTEKVRRKVSSPLSPARRTDGDL